MGTPAPPGANGEPRWIDTLSLFVYETGGTEVESAIADFERDVEQANLFNDPESNEFNSIWLHARTDNEGASRVAPIYEATFIPLPSNDVFNPIQRPNEIFYGSLTITRGAFESQGATTPTISGTKSLGGGTFDLPAGGTLPSRLSILTFKPATNTLDRMWMGWRYDQGSALDPVMSMGSVSDVRHHTNGDSSRITSDPTFTNVAQITFASNASMGYRCSRELTGDPEKWAGYHTVLIIARVTASNPVRMRLSLSMEDPDDFAGNGINSVNQLGEVVVEDTDYRIYDCGILQFPGMAPRALFYDNIPAAKLALINVEAETLSGTDDNDLRLAEIILIPAEHRIYLDNIDAPVTDGQVIILTSEDWQTQVYANDTGETDLGTPEAGTSKWGQIPRRGATVVLAGERSGIHNPSDNIGTITASLYERWSTYRDD